MPSWLRHVLSSTLGTVDNDTYLCPITRESLDSARELAANVLDTVRRSPRRATGTPSDRYRSYRSWVKKLKNGSCSTTLLIAPLTPPSDRYDDYHTQISHAHTTLVAYIIFSLQGSSSVYYSAPPRTVMAHTSTDFPPMALLLNWSWIAMFDSISLQPPSCHFLAHHASTWTVLAP